MASARTEPEGAGGGRGQAHPSRAGEACGQELPNHCTAWLVAGDLILSLPLPLDNVLS